MFVRVLLNKTHDHGPPGTTQCVNSPFLCNAKLFTTQIYIETDFARITQTIEKFKNNFDNHVLGRMDITRFQTVIFGEFLLLTFVDTFSGPAQTGLWRLIQFHGRITGPYSVARVIFAQ